MSHRPSPSCVVAIAVLVALAACDPTYDVRGVVVDGSGAPIAGATVAMECPGATAKEATSKVDGSFSIGGVGRSRDLATDCSLRIEKPGFVTQTIRVTGACLRGSDVGNGNVPCGPADGKVVLAR
jgi:hypothetical protein